MQSDAVRGDVRPDAELANDRGKQPRQSRTSSHWRTNSGGWTCRSRSWRRWCGSAGAGNGRFDESRWRSYLAGQCGPSGGRVKGVNAVAR